MPALRARSEYGKFSLRAGVVTEGAEEIGCRDRFAKPRLMLLYVLTQDRVIHKNWPERLISSSIGNKLPLIRRGSSSLWVRMITDPLFRCIGLLKFGLAAPVP